MEFPSTSLIAGLVFASFAFGDAVKAQQAPQSIMYLDEASRVIPASSIPWVDLMAFSITEGRSREQVSANIRPMDRETFEVRRARDEIMAMVESAVQGPAPAQLREARILVAYEMFVPEYRFEDQEFVFCRPDQVRIPAQRIWRYPTNSGALVTLNGAFNLDHRGLATQRGWGGPFGCGLSRRSGDLRVRTH